MSVVGSVTKFITIEATSCGSCDIPFGLETSHIQKLQDNGNWFYCPNGHQIHYSTGSEIKRLRDELEGAQRTAIALREQRDAERRRGETLERSAAAFKGQVTRIKKRVANGVCLVAGCKRHFTNLERHMATVHPEVAE